MASVMEVAPMTPAEFREIRKSLGYSQEKLARVLDRTGGTINVWETSGEPVSPIVALAMRQLLAEQAARKSSETSGASTTRKSKNRKQNG